MNKLFRHSTKVDLEIVDYEEMFGCKPDDSDLCDDEVVVDIDPKTATIDISSVVRAENAEKTTPTKSRSGRRSSRRAVY
jgi:hypothetical protein